jgi:hypothetical protein
MFSHSRIRPALLSTLAVLLLFLTAAGAPGASVSQATTSSPAGGVGVAAAPCNLLTQFNASNFPSSPKIDNTWFPLTPGTQFILDGRINVGGQPLNHQVILTVTDLTKMVHGVRTVVLWERDINSGVLVESELAFHAQDNSENIWNLGEYPAQYSGGHFTDAPDTWLSGLAGAQGGTVFPGNPQTGTPVFLQAYAPGIIGDCGQVTTRGTPPAPYPSPLCVPVGCYNNVVVVSETSPGEPGTQQKFYATGPGNFYVGATDNDPQGETLVLSETLKLSRNECIAARQAALALEAQAYNDTSQTVYKSNTSPAMVSTGFCETIQAPSPTPTPSVSPTPKPPTPTLTPKPPTPTPRGAPDPNLYLPTAFKAFAAQTPPPPAIYDGCKTNPNPAGALDFPVRIVGVDKVAEIVTLQNISDKTISLEDWNMCSLGTHQDHDQIFGTIGPGQTRTFPNTGGSLIWADNQRDDAALYNAAGFIVSYWVDQ